MAWSERGQKPFKPKYESGSVGSMFAQAMQVRKRSRHGEVLQMRVEGATAPLQKLTKHISRPTHEKISGDLDGNLSPLKQHGLEGGTECTLRLKVASSNNKDSHDHSPGE